MSKRFSIKLKLKSDPKEWVNRECEGFILTPDGSIHLQGKIIQNKNPNEMPFDTLEVFSGSEILHIHVRQTLPVIEVPTIITPNQGATMPLKHESDDSQNTENDVNPDPVSSSESTEGNPPPKFTQFSSKLVSITVLSFPSIIISPGKVPVPVVNIKS